MTLKSAKKLAKQMMRKHKVSHVFDFSLWIPRPHLVYAMIHQII